jgi:hypothetical protein
VNARVHLKDIADPRKEVRAAAAPRPQLQVARPQPQGDADPAQGRRSLGRWLTPVRLAFLATLALLTWGLRFPTEQYITPQTGFGYALGIVGGSAMLILLVYPLRKRIRALAFIGTTKRWFQAHMVLGVAGPVLILFHSNFSLGATNSNVALACMLVVSGSGLFGRYFYAHIHHGLHGRKATLAELKEYAEKLRWVTTNVEFLPGLVDRIDAEERDIVARSERAMVLARPVVSAYRVARARRRLRRYVAGELRTTRSRSVSGIRQDRLLLTANAYVDDRLAATRRVVEFGAFERLFSLWHALHMPLFIMLLVAGVVHVVAVHVY